MPAIDLNLVYTILASLVLVGALFLLLRRGLAGELGARLFVAILILSLLWTLSLLLRWSALEPELVDRLLLYQVALLTVVFFQLGLALLFHSKRSWIGWLLGALWLLLMIGLGEDWPKFPWLLWRAGNWQLTLPTLVYALGLLGWTAFTVSLIFISLRTFQRLADPHHRNRLTYWFATMILATTGMAMFFSGWTFPGNGIYLLGVLGAGYLVTHIHLPDVRQVGRVALIYLVTTLAAAGIYLLLFWLAQVLPQAAAGIPPFWVAVSLALLLSVVLNPFLRHAHRWFTRRIGGAVQDPQTLLSRYSHQISNILDLQMLAQTVIQFITENFNISQAMLYVVYPEPAPAKETGSRAYLLRDPLVQQTLSRQVLMSLMREKAMAIQLSADGPLASYFSQPNPPLHQYDIDLLPRFRNSPPDELRNLQATGSDLYVPILTQDQWIGLLALGHKRSGDLYYEDDLRLLSTLADQTAMALKNARLYDDLKKRNIENERLNQQLIAANRQLTRLDKAKSDFLNIASHELRTPLTQIRGYNDMVAEVVETGDLPKEEILKLCQSVRKAAMRLEEIIDVMFDISRLDTATLDLELEVTTLSAIVAKAVEKWEFAFRQRKQTLNVSNLEGLPAVSGDSKRLVQVFSHLIQNAIKYTPDGGKIEITGRSVTEPETQALAVEVIIADSGIGIAATDLEPIFDKFYRAGNILQHSTGDIKFKGAGPGLGLTIARGIIEAHGGRIWAESPGYDEASCPGSKFHVLLPVSTNIPLISPSESRDSSDE